VTKHLNTPHILRSSVKHWKEAAFVALMVSSKFLSAGMHISFGSGLERLPNAIDRYVRFQMATLRFPNKQ
jgi:hypothetical protein